MLLRFALQDALCEIQQKVKPADVIAILKENMRLDGDYNGRTVAELKEMLDTREISRRGLKRKADFIDALERDDRFDGTALESADEQQRPQAQQRPQRSRRRRKRQRTDSGASSSNECGSSRDEQRRVLPRTAKSKTIAYDERGSDSGEDSDSEGGASYAGSGTESEESEEGG